MVDMESSAVAAVCGERLVRFLAVRVISDDAQTDLPREVASLHHAREATASARRSGPSGTGPRASRTSGRSTSTRSKPPTGWRSSVAMPGRAGRLKFRRDG